jgi:hypothetical protein
MSDPQMSLSEAVLAMLAMVIVLCFVLFYYCILPCYNNYKKHHWTREQANGEDWESDPRWNNHKFQFVPRKPADYLTDKKYSRLGACSRTSSMRSNNPLLDGAQDLGEQTPSNLDVEASQPVIPPLTGKVKLTKKPPKYSEIYKTNDKTGSVGSVSSTNTSSLSNPPEYSSKTPSVEMNLNQDNSPKDQIQTQPNVAGAKPPRTKIRFEKPKKNKKQIQSPPADENQSGTCSPDTTKEAT